MKRGERSTSRVGDLVAGVCMVCLGAAVILLGRSSSGWGSVLVGTGLVGLGCEAVLSSAMDRRSIVSRIGPLP